MHAGGSVQWQDKEDEAEQVRVLCNALFRLFCFESLSYPPLFRRYERCSTCGGGGCKDGKAKAKCSGCNGQGVKIIRLAQLAAAKLFGNCFWAANCVVCLIKMIRRQIGPGMVQQMQVQRVTCDV